MRTLLLLLVGIAIGVVAYTKNLLNIQEKIENITKN